MKRLITGLFVVLVFAQSKAQHALVQSLLNDVRLDSLTLFVRQLSGKAPVKIGGVMDTIKSRHILQPGNEKAFQFMKEQFIRYGYQVDSMQYSAAGKNLFAIKPGYKYPNRRYMLGAHYDNLPGQTVAQGADDNASGSATVLEGGRIFRNYNFPFTVVFALWDEEEQGLVGSAAYAPTIGSDGDTLIGYVNVDMLGWDGNNDSIADINVKNVANSVAFANRSKDCNTAYNIKLNIHILNPGEESSDQASFWNNNRTAISVGEEHHTNFYPYWHTAGDSLAHFNLSYYQKCSKLAYATIADCATDTLKLVGIKELGIKGNLTVHPNPFAESITISPEQAAGITQEISVSDCFGRIVYKETTNSSLTSLALPWLAPGIYFIRLQTETSSYVARVIKQ